MTAPIKSYQLKPGEFQTGIKSLKEAQQNEIINDKGQVVIADRQSWKGRLFKQFRAFAGAISGGRWDLKHTRADSVAKFVFNACKASNDVTTDDISAAKEYIKDLKQKIDTRIHQPGFTSKILKKQNERIKGNITKLLIDIDNIKPKIKPEPKPIPEPELKPKIIHKAKPEPVPLKEVVEPKPKAKAEPKSIDEGSEPKDEQTTKEALPTNIPKPPSFEGYKEYQEKTKYKGVKGGGESTGSSITKTKKTEPETAGEKHGTVLDEAVKKQQEKLDAGKVSEAVKKADDERAAKTLEEEAVPENPLLKEIKAAAKKQEEKTTKGVTSKAVKHMEKERDIKINTKETLQETKTRLENELKDLGKQLSETDDDDQKSKIKKNKYSK